MRRLNSIFLFLFVFILSENVYSQVANYSFSQSTGTYTPITGGTVSASGSGIDDGIVSVTLPTAFTFNGNSITTVGFSANGYLIMGNTTTHGLIPISSTATSNGVIAALAMDLVANASSSELRWEQIGNEIIFQWKEFKRYNLTPFTNEVFSFQIKINTSTGGINIVYDGSSSVNVSTTRIPQVGLRGTTNSDYNARRLTTSVPDSSPSWDDTAEASSNAHNVRFTSTSPAAFPSAGLTFTWTPPSCLAPGGLNTTNVTSTSATIGWTAVPSATGGYEWEVRTTGACGSGSPVQSGTTSSTSVNLSGLTANTTYTYCVRSICDGPSNSGWVSGSFTTQLVVAAPYNEPFITTTTPAGYNITGWSIGSIRGVTGNPGNNIYKNLYSSAPNGTFTTVNIGPIASGMFLTFDYKTANYDPPYDAPGTGTGDFTVSISTDFGSNYTVISTIGNTNTNAWQQYSQDLSAYAGQNVKIRIIGTWVSGDYDLAFDNIKIETPPSCLTPTGLMVGSITTTSAAVSWTAPVPAPGVGYEWAVTTSITPPVSGAPTASTSALATGLAPNTTYYLHVRSECTAGIEYSPWATSASFYTGYCLASSTSQASWISAFSTTNGNSNITHTAGSGAPGGYIDLSATNSVSNFIGNPTNFSITSGGPTVGNAIWVDWNNNLQFETGERMYVSTGYGTTVSGSFSIPMATPNGNYRMRVITDYNNSTPSNPCGNISRGEYKDFNFEVISAPTCFVPTTLNISNITNNSSTINWTEPVPPAGTGYEWEVRTSGAAGSGPTGLVASGSVATGMTMANVSGLTSNTMYMAYVRSDCGAGDYSNWSSGVSFTTLCDPFTIPYDESFESAVVPAYPSCVTGVNTPTRTTTATGAQPRTGTKYVNIRWTPTSTKYLYSAPVTLTGSTSYDFGFWYLTDGLSGWTSIKLLVNNQPSATGATQLGIVNNATNTTYQELKSAYVPGMTGTFYLIIEVIHTSAPNDMSIDDIYIYQTPTDAVDWGNLQWPENGTIFPQNTYVSYGQAWEPGVTDMTGQGAGLNAWVGWSNSNTDPATWPTGNWISAPFNVDAGNNDEFSGTFPANTFTPGTYYYAYRYQLNGGPFRYGAYSAGGGGFWDGTTYVNGVLTVNSCPSITPSATPSSICVGDESVLNVTSANTNYTYEWNPGLLSGAMHMVSPVATTQYTVTATDAGNGCVITANISVVVNVLPEGSITPSTPISIDCGDIQELNAIVPIEAKDYIFSPSSGSFTPVIGGTDVNVIEADDAHSGAIPIGFNFMFENVSYTDVYANSNGWLSFNSASGSATDAQWRTNASTAPAAMLPLIAPLFDDLDGADDGGVATYITEGIAPNRVFTMEWLNWQWGFTSGAAISFQVKLYETTNKIEFVYRQESDPLSLPSASIGLFTSSTNYLMLNGTGINPNALDNTFTTNLSTKPATGQIYAFERPLAIDYEWSGPSGTIFTDMAATIPYTGQNISTVYVQPTTGGTNTYSVEIEGANGCKSTFNKDVEVGSCAIALNTKVFLTNVSSGTMSDVLRTLPDFPLTDPYTTAPYTTSGLFTYVPAQTPATTTLTILNNNNIVDWVFVELRTGTSGSTTVAASKSGLLKNDGVIINPDGTPFSFSGVAAGNYFVAIKHRNHCGFMTNGTFVVPNPSLLNLTDNSVTLYEPSHPALQLKGTGEYAMWTGDAVVNGAVNGGDVNFVRGLSGVSSGEYNRADVNLNGAVNGADVNAVRGNSGQRTWQID